MPDSLSLIRLVGEAVSMYFEPLARHRRMISLPGGEEDARRLGRRPIDSLLGYGMTMRGDFSAKDHALRVDGEFFGNITCDDGIVVIADDAIVVGNVSAGYIVVNGRVSGNLFAKSAIELLPSAVVDGDVSASLVEMQAGAAVSGKMMSLQDPASAESTILRRNVRELARHAPRSKDAPQRLRVVNAR